MSIDKMENEDKLSYCAQMLLMHTFIPRSKSKNDKAIFDFISVTKNELELSNRLENLGFKLIVDKTKEVVYVQNRFDFTYIELKKNTTILALILLKAFVENVNGRIDTHDIMVSDIKKSLEDWNQTVLKTEFTDSISLLEKNNIISYNCSKDKINNNDSIITIYPSILCWLNIEDERVQNLIDECMNNKEIA